MENFTNLPKKVQNPLVKWAKLAFVVAEKSRCLRPESRVGAVAVKDGNVLSEGFNGAVCSTYHCGERNYCVRQKNNVPSGTQREIAYCICAEQRMICSAAHKGISLYGATAYLTHKPCAYCVRLMIECGFEKAYYSIEYVQPFADEVSKEFGFELIKID